jgi:phasin family protein
MTSITEQLSATSKSHIESQLNLMDTVLRKSVEGVQQVVALNLNTARNVLERSANTARELLDARDPREVLTLATKPLPTVEGLLSYSRELFGIASRAQVDLLQSASAQFRTLPGRPSAPAAQAPLRLATEAAAQVVAQTVPQVRDVTHEVVDNVAAASEAIEHSAAQATQVATEATTHAAQEAAAAAREAARASAEAAAPLQQATENVVAAASDNVQRATEHVVAAASDNVQQATESVIGAASDNVEQATAAIAAAVAEAAPVTPAAVTSDDSIPASRATRGKPSAKPVAQALADIADKAPAKSAPGKNQPRK